MTTANTPSEDGAATPAVGIPLDRQVRPPIDALLFENVAAIDGSKRGN